MPLRRNDRSKEKQKGARSMWVNKKDWEFMRKKVAVMDQDLISKNWRIKFLEDFCRSVANTEGLSVLSYQQLHAPITKNHEKVRELFEMSERRRNDLIQEGVDPDKMAEMAVRLFEIMQEEGFSLREASTTSEILINMTERVYRRKSDEKLKDIG